MSLTLGKLERYKACWKEEGRDPWANRAAGRATGWAGSRQWLERVPRTGAGVTASSVHQG